MSSISGSSTFSVGAYSNKGMAGLASGLDTEGMVEQMLAGTQAKIDKQTGMKQQLTWKQEIYRELITDINKFRDMFFDLDSSTYLKSTSYFDAMLATTKSSAFKVTGTSAAQAGVSSLAVQQLATATKARSSAAVSGTLSGKVDMSAFDRTVIFELDDRSEIEVDLSGATSEADVAKKINDAFAAAVASGNTKAAGITATYDDGNGKMSIKSSQKLFVSSKSDALGLQMAGLGGNQYSVKDGVLSTDGYTMSGTVSKSPEISMIVALDGKQSTIKFTDAEIDTIKAMGSGSAQDTALQDLFEKKINAAFGSNQDGSKAIKMQKNSDGTFSLTAGVGRQIQVAGGSVALEGLGLVSGQSNKVSTSVALENLQFDKALQGERFKFTINDVEFEFSKSDSVYTVMSRINNSDAGVKVSYSALDDKFTIENKDTGAGREIKTDQQEGNLLTAMFGIQAGDEVVSKGMGTKSITGTKADSTINVKYGTFSYNVDGRDYSISFPSKGTNSHYTTQEVIDEINRAMEAQHGFASDGSGSANIFISKDADNKLVINSKNGSVITFDEFTDAEPEAIKQNLAYQLGFSVAGKETSNVITKDTKLSDIGLSDQDVGATINNKNFADATVEDLKALGIGFDGVKQADGTDDWSKFTGRLTMGDSFLTNTALSPTDKNKLATKFFGVSASEFHNSRYDNTTGAAIEDKIAGMEEGKNAIVSINGVKTERSDNSFTVNGLNIELLAVSQTTRKVATADEIAAGLVKPGSTNATDGTSEVYSTDDISTVRDTEKVFTGLKTFVEEYNKLIEKLNGYVDADQTYKKYDPLTEKQRKELSEREIEQWEEKAKEGLLHRDQSLDTLLSSMRTIMYQKPDGAKYALYDLGIESGSYKSKGKLVLNETKLKQMLTSDPEAIKELFTDTTSGLSKLLTDSIDKAAKMSSGNPGSLVQTAGVKGYGTDKNNEITKKITDINSRIKQLNAQYEKERQRYWNQFNKMESIIAQFSSQSAWLGQQFGA